MALTELRVHIGNNGKYCFRQLIAITTDPQRLSGIHLIIVNGTSG